MNHGGNMASMLSLWRRHVKGVDAKGNPLCAHGGEGRGYTKCSCPIWCDGEINGQRVRCSLDTRDWGRAGRKLADLEHDIERGLETRTVEKAKAAFLEHCEIEPSTRRKYTRWSNYLTEFAEAHEVDTVSRFTLTKLDQYRATRKVNALTWSKELQFLRSFFSFCQARRWTDENPAKAMKMPPDPKPGERPPYTRDEIAAILVACDRFGRHSYERLRARAIILLLRFYGLRLSDAATLQRARVKDGQIMVRAMKNGQLLWLPLYSEVWHALECLPMPKDAKPDCPYFFWSGNGDKESIVKQIERTLLRMFEKSGVANAQAHRFRHTLATEILSKGGTIEDAANILGDDPETIRKYYLKWSPQYQARTMAIMAAIHGTPMAQLKNSALSPLFSVDSVVAKVGVEPTRTVKCARF